MTRTELAESMAEFCGESYEQRVAEGTRETPVLFNSTLIMGAPEKEDWLKSQELFYFRPDGFFAVWDRLEKESKPSFGRAWVPFSEKYLLHDVDRYTAFYEAVHAMVRSQSKHTKGKNDA